VVEVEPLIRPSEGDRVLGPSIRGGRTNSRHQYLTVVELLLPLAFLQPMSTEDDVDFSDNVWEGSTSSPLLLLGMLRFSRSSSWWGRRQRLEGSAVPHGMLEVSAVPKGVAHVLVVRALGVEDVVQRAFASARSSSGARGGWSGGVDFFTRPLLLAFVGLLVRVTSWCRRCRLCSSDEVLSSFVGGDVEVSFPEQLLGGSRCFLEYGADDGRVIRSTVEVLDHCCLCDLGDTISHGLKPFEVRPKSLIPSALDGFEVPWLHQFVGERLEVGGEASTKIAPVVDAVLG
jgi:hypothetical protein